MDRRITKVPEISTFFLCLVKAILSDMVINTDSGLLQGVPSLADDVEAFLGIPYAEPPVGELRFAKPVPKQRWYDVYNAEHLPPVCPQYIVYPYYFVPDVTHMSEDCLYLNMWVPRSESKHGLRPIVIFFHHGAFVSGSSNMKVFDGSRLANRGNVIVVTVNYRLGTLGFLAADTEEVEGNMGMYDQIMAMKWTKRNAKRFGGNPENIVLMGVSAGAISVTAHLVSPLSKNLFQKAIVQSGTLLMPLFADNTILYKSSESVASILGCANDTVTLKGDTQSVLKCLRRKPIEAFIEAEGTLFMAHPITFYPRIKEAFLPKTMSELLRDGNLKKNVDILIGMTAQEGAMFLLVGMRHYFDSYGRDNINMNRHRAITIARTACLTVGLVNSSFILDFYLRQVKNLTSTGYTKMISNLIGDYASACSTVFFADFSSLQRNSVYFYKFEFRPPSTPMGEWTGSTHLDEVPYVFGNPVHENFTSEEIALSYRLMDRWLNFAKIGNPNIPGHIPWLQYNYETPLYMSFGQEEESIRFRPNNRCEFWRKDFGSEFNWKLNELLTSLAVNAWGQYSVNFLISMSVFIILLYV